MVVKLDQDRSTLDTLANDPQLLASFSRYGHGIEYLQAGMVLNDLARASLKSQGYARLNKVTAQQNFQKDWRRAMIHYQTDLHMARMSLKEYNGTHYFLKLDGARAKGFKNWHGQAKGFYSGLQGSPMLLEIVVPLGLTMERIEQGLQLLQALESMYKQKKDVKGDAVDTLQQRREAYRAFNLWMVDFRAMARLAFKSQPAHLVRLGLEPQSRKAKSKVEAIQGAIPASSVTPAQLVAGLVQV